jgi:hypothetical protein
MHPTRIFKTESDLQKAWEEYKIDLKEKSKEWLKIQYVGKDGDKKEDAFKLPLTLEGFKRYCWDKYGTVEQYFTNQDKCYDEFIGICSRIKNEIRENQIIGGMLGLFNPSITQRLNGLKEQTETELKGSLNIPNLPDIGNRK